MNILITLTTIGSDLVDPLTLTPDIGVAVPSTALKSELLAGVQVLVDNAATQISITSTGSCVGAVVIPITPLIAMNYGYLYNWYASGDVREITSIGWRVPSYADFSALITYTGNSAFALKRPGTQFWFTNNGLDTYGFNAKGTGFCSNNGFSSVKVWMVLRGSDDLGDRTTDMELTDGGYLVTLPDNGSGKTSGLAVRVVRNTALPQGTIGTYIGNDGRHYPTIVIGNQEWTSECLIETRFRNGDIIPEIPGPNWATLETPARCYYVI